MMSETVRERWVYEGPRSPCSALPRNSTYCCQSGLSSPYAALSFSCTAAGIGFSQVSHGPPGVACIRKKVSV